jgi:hypothetical protein
VSAASSERKTNVRSKPSRTKAETPRSSSLGETKPGQKGALKGLSWGSLGGRLGEEPGDGERDIRSERAVGPEISEDSNATDGASIELPLNAKSVGGLVSPQQGCLPVNTP